MDGKALYKLVESLTNLQMHPVAVAETQSAPFVYYSRKEHEPLSQKNGAGLGEKSTWTISSVGSSYEQAHANAMLIRAAIDGYTGTVTVGEGAGAVNTTLSLCRVADQVDGFDDEASLHIIQLEINIIQIF